MAKADEPPEESKSPPSPARPRSRLKRPSPEFLLIVLIAAAIVALAAGLGSLWWRRTTTHAATAWLEVHAPDASLIASRQAYGKEIIDRYKRTMAALVKQPAVLAAAATDPRVTRTQWYDRHKGEVVEALDRAVVVTPIPETSLIRFTMTGRNGDELADIVNAVADSFVEYTARDTRSPIQKDVGKLEAESKDLKSRLDQIRQELAEAGEAQALPEKVAELLKVAAACEEDLGKLDRRILDLTARASGDPRASGPVSVKTYATTPR